MTRSESSRNTVSKLTLGNVFLDNAMRVVPDLPAHTMRIFTPILVLLSALPLLGGCEAENNPVAQTINCDQICDRYTECVDSDHDADRCQERCERESEQEAEYAQQVATCETCLDEQSCSESLDCADDCGALIFE